MEKIFYKIAIAIIAIVLLGIAGINYSIDPFFVYHAPKNGLKPVFYGQMYQNHGMAKYFDYDALITGTSMTENFRASWFSEKFDCNAIKLPFAGGNMKDFTMLFDIVFDSKKDLKYVFFGLDLYTLLVEPDSTRFEYSKYQLSDNLFYDVEYLLNNNILSNYSIKSYLIGKDALYTPKIDEIYTWSDKVEFGTETVLKNYNRPEKSSENTGAVNENDNFKENFNSLLKYIKENRDTKFYIFFPPYSILYWDYANNVGNKDFYINLLNEVSKELLSNENVELYSFITNIDIITNLDNYKDYTHYNQDVNKYMLDCFGTDDNRLTVNNHAEKFMDFKDFLNSYDFESIFSK